MLRNTGNMANNLKACSDAVKSATHTHTHSLLIFYTFLITVTVGTIQTHSFKICEITLLLNLQKLEKGLEFAVSTLNAGVWRGKYQNLPKIPLLTWPVNSLPGYETDTLWRGVITNAISQKKFWGSITALDTTWNLANKMWLLKWESEYAGQKRRYQRAPARREVPSKLSAESHLPNQTQETGGTGSTIWASDKYILKGTTKTRQ